MLMMEDWTEVARRGALHMTLTSAAESSVRIVVARPGLKTTSGSSKKSASTTGDMIEVAPEAISQSVSFYEAFCTAGFSP
uniref:Lactoylglutathione lyase n=1 Tax=Steinernema glaseri TaxID=37863 RepID=A0A1I7ZX80_9BILA